MKLHEALAIVLDMAAADSEDSAEEHRESPGFNERHDDVTDPAACHQCRLETEALEIVGAHWQAERMKERA